LCFFPSGLGSHVSVDTILYKKKTPHAKHVLPNSVEFLTQLDPSGHLRGVSSEKF